MSSSMAMAALRGRLGRSFGKMRDTSTMDETALNSCLNEITIALLEADFPRLLVKETEMKSHEIINLPPISNKGELIYKIFLGEFIRKIDPGISALIQEKSEPSVVMFIGLRGVDKIKTCACYARYHLKKGFKPAIVCVDDTLNTDSPYVRLKDVPVYQSDEKIPSQRIAKFKNEKRDLIIVDTGDCHKECSTLFEEMHQLAKAVNPDLVIYVLDSNLGQAAFDQAQAFKQSFIFGVVVLINVNSAPKACGAISATAAAKCPMILAQTGEHTENPWVSPEFEHMDYTLRNMYNFYRGELGLDKENYRPLVRFDCVKQNHEKMRRYVTIMDSMTDEELDKSKVKSGKRMMEIARDCKVNVKEVMEMMKTYKGKAKAFAEVQERCRKKSD